MHTRESLMKPETIFFLQHIMSEKSRVLWWTSNQSFFIKSLKSKLVKLGGHVKIDCNTDELPHTTPYAYIFSKSMNFKKVTLKVCKKDYFNQFVLILD